MSPASQPDALRIERLSVADLERFRALRLRSLRDAPDAFGSTLEETAARPRESWVQQLTDLPTFVAVRGGQDLGVVRGARDRQDPALAWLISMWVAPEARGQGVGDRLVRAVIDWARAEGFTTLQLDVGDHNPAATRLYARSGFQPTGEVGHLPPPRGHLSEHRRALRL